MKKSEVELSIIKGFGQKSLVEVKERIGALKISALPVEEKDKPDVEVEEPVPSADEVQGVVEAVVEETVEAVEEEVEEEEEEDDLIPYVPPVVEIAGDKPVLRFAEDIFPADFRGTSGKKGKKKKNRGGTSPGASGKKKHKAPTRSAPNHK